ncbi:CAAX family amino protease [Ligilactobacillus salitolerans]|uniref:CAAX family amino protease n=1 Tax=Ligilactobacillus salitolerans TaxID=1808352 RepID=A0A401IWM0_9LACO|nr:CPBP family intramembrane glutamic endopeptidase [Ligilactobacillus salitolerans]GBG95895.1 CAAX family amino protease [Ligilactobacillus salitolerans]
MKFKANSLNLLLAYFVLLFSQQICFQLIKNNAILFPVETVLYLGGAAGLVWLFIHYRYCNMFENRPAGKGQTACWIILGVPLILAAQRLLFWLEVTWLKQPAVSENTASLQAISVKYPYYLLVIALAAPIIEELIFRKVLFGNFTYWFKPWQTALLSSLLFALAHGDGHYLTYTIIGLVLCLIYGKTGRIQASMAVHILMNCAVLLLN